MKGIYFIILILLFQSSTAYTRESTASLAEIEKRFKAFEYLEVINLSKEYLVQQPEAPNEALIEVYRMRAIAYYSLGELNASLSDLLKILRLDPDYQLDPLKTSPKIISFFEEIRSNFLQNRTSETSQSAEKPPIAGDDSQIQIAENSEHFRGALLRSLILPGWGHLNSGYRTRGWILMGVSAAALTGSVYFIRETQLKEQDYLNETNRLLIDERYKEFNNAYKKRNALIAAYVLIWLYTQIDLLYFSKNRNSPPDSPSITLLFPVSSLPRSYYRPALGVQLNLAF